VLALLKFLYALFAVIWALYTFAIFLGYTIDPFIIAFSFVNNAVFYALAFLEERGAK
jgi:hypothetical protein